MHDCLLRLWFDFGDETGMQLHLRLEPWAVSRRMDFASRFFFRFHEARAGRITQGIRIHSFAAPNLGCQLLVAETMWFVGLHTYSVPALCLIRLEVALAPVDITVSFERQDVCRNPV